MSQSSRQRDARMALASLGAVTDPTLVASIAEKGPLRAWVDLLAEGTSTEMGRRSRMVDLHALQVKADTLGYRFITPGDPEWPSQLEDLDGKALDGLGGACLGLWVRGQTLDVGRAVTIVGSRASTAYGEHCAEQFAAELAGHGLGLVAPLSYGIGLASMRGALAGGSAVTLAVPGGIDRLPVKSWGDAHAVAVTQATVVSEFPPSATPFRANFLARNRVLAALGVAVVVVDAMTRSSASEVVRWGHELGRPVLAVPGPITVATSSLPHSLIRRGLATLATSLDDVIEALEQKEQVNV